MAQKLALLVGANPRVAVHGPTVRLYAGDWKVSAPELKDSVLILERKTPTSIVGSNVEHDMIIDGNCSVEVSIGKRGSEDILNVYAELVNYESDSTKL